MRGPALELGSACGDAGVHPSHTAELPKLAAVTGCGGVASVPCLAEFCCSAMAPSFPSCSHPLPLVFQQQLRAGTTQHQGRVTHRKELLGE